MPKAFRAEEVRIVDLPETRVALLARIDETVGLYLPLREPLA